jgi:hypothetical protein
MEGHLKKYDGYLRGYKSVFAKIKNSMLTVEKEKSQKTYRFELTPQIFVEPNPKDSSEFFLNTIVNKKPKKYHFKAKDQQERDQWIRAIKEAQISALEE